MIPKIIHYCWFGGGEMPPDQQRYVDGWRRLHSGWEIKRWDETNFDIAHGPRYLREAAAMGAWAFVADVCRIEALYRFGGFYLDTDIELLKPLDSLLDEPTFGGDEGTGMAMGVIGARPGEVWLQRFRDYYARARFINPWGHPVRTPNPTTFARSILPLLSDAERPKVFEKDVFYPELLSDGSAAVTARTVAIHHYAASWRHRRTLWTRIATICRGLRARYFGNCGRGK